MHDQNTPVMNSNTSLLFIVDIINLGGAAFQYNSEIEFRTANYSEYIAGSH